MGVRRRKADKGVEEQSWLLGNSPMQGVWGAGGGGCCTEEGVESAESL